MTVFYLTISYRQTQQVLLRPHKSPGSIASPILPPSPPPLLPLGTVKCRLPKLDIDFVVRLAEPVAELVSASSFNVSLLDVLLEIFGADPTGV